MAKSSTVTPQPAPEPVAADTPKPAVYAGPFEPGKLYRFVVSIGAIEPSEVVAPNPDEAWALWCDRRASWPDNSARSVVCYGEA